MSCVDFKDEEEVPPESGKDDKDQGNNDEAQKDEADKDEQDQSEKSDAEKSQEGTEDTGSKTETKVRHGKQQTHINMDTVNYVRNTYCFITGGKGSRQV